MKSKKFFSALLACVLLLSIMQVTATATTDNMNFEKMDYSRFDSIADNAQDFLDSTGYKNTLNVAVPMHNLNEEIEAVYFSLQPTGYLIASYKDGHVIEFSPESKMIELNDTIEKLYYNGLLQYYEERDSSHIVQIPTETLMKKNDLQNIYEKPYVENIPTLYHTDSLSSFSLEPSNPTPTHWVAYSSANRCTITGITNLLQYYVDFKGADMYADKVSNIVSLRNYLGENRYIRANGAYKLSWAARACAYDNIYYYGLGAYLKLPDVDTFNVYAPKASISEMKLQLNNYARPILMDVKNNLLMENSNTRHVIMAYTYMETANTTYFIVNDGYDHNIVYICADDIDVPIEIMYLSKS